MNHQEWEGLIPFYLAKTLPDTQVRQLEGHLATCPDCQQSLREWQGIASAVWTDAHVTASRRPPALSADFYARLREHEHTGSNQDWKVERERIATRRIGRNRLTFPVTLVAGLLLTVVFGALLVSGVLRPTTPPDPGQLVALAGTPAEIEDPSGAPKIDISPMPSQAFGGILPTPEPLPSATPEKNLPVGGAAASAMLAVPQNNADTAQLSYAAPVGGAPYITLTPGLLLDGYHLCMLFNPTGVAIPVYRTADAGAEIIGSVAPGEEYRTLIRSKSGWYMIVVAGAGWVDPQQAYLRGNCAADQFWVPTPTPIVTPFAALIESLNSVPMQVIVPDANQYASPEVGAPLVAVLTQGQTVVAIAQTEVDGVRWIQVVPVDGLDGWVLADSVAE